MGDGEVCVVNDVEVVEDESFSRYELKRGFECVVGDAELVGSPQKKPAKEATPNDDVTSGVSDPVFPNNDNSLKLQACGSPRAELDSTNRVSSGELTSISFGSRSSSLSSEYSTDDNNSRNDISSRESISDVVLELPKHASSTGIRKITFKFSKIRKEHDDRLQSSASTARSLSNNRLQEGDSCLEFHEEQCSTSHVSHNLELKMSKKVVFDSYPSNVKKLLSTGILEGARVKYISATREKEIPGIISGSGYLCGCPTCNYSNVISAYEFELHAGGAKTRHPNNHIHLENGRPIYSIIEQLKTSPPGMLEEVVKDVAGSSFNEGSFNAWRELRQYRLLSRAEKYYQMKTVHSSWSLLSSQGRGTEYKPSVIAFEDIMPSKLPSTEKHSTEGLKHPNISFSHATNMLGAQKKERCAKRRDNDLHRLLFMPEGLPDGAELAYCVKGQKLLQGYKQGSGIVCGHCDCEISPSQFEAHAGWGARRQPYRHIYTSNGVTLHDIAISLQNGQKLTTGHSDDMCTVCGEQEGKLTLCSGCPRAYHAGCLGSEFLTGEDDWRCPNCCGSNSVPGNSSTSPTKPIIIRLTRVVKPSENESGGCVFCRANDFSATGFDDRTVIICDQCEKEYHIGCLRDNGLCDLKELPANKWFCSGNCSRIHVSLMEHFLKGPEFIPYSALEAINKRFVEKGLCHVAEGDVQWQLISGKNCTALHRPFLSKAATIFRECFNPIVTSSGRDLIPVMVYGRNISGQDFGNMYTAVLIVNSVVVSAALLRIFNCEVAELPLVATSKEKQGKGYFQVLFTCIERFLSSLNVQKLVLPGAEEAKSIWTNKFGFSSMSQEQLSKYTSELTLTAFKGTYWLEKMLEHPTY
ncbi:hypothetical protein Dimus_007299 [Dionaea muscipula]